MVSVTVLVKSAIENLIGDVALMLPQGWRSEPSSLPVQLKSKGNEQGYTFLVYPPHDANEGDLHAKITIDGKSYNQENVIINYDHIPYQIVQRPGVSKILKLNIQKGADKIAYINGAGDEVANCLEQIGYHVNVIAEKDISADVLAGYDAVVLGIRAYNTVDRLRNVQPLLMDYVQRGGNLIVQYNTNFRLVTQDIGPYPLKLGRERVSQENAEMRFLLPDHAVLNSPNKITSKDFEHWIQERGLYYPSEWDKKQYAAILSSNDDGEPARDGGLLIAKYGDGNFVYTGLAFFRELPSGVPGAYRLFANMLALKKNAKS